MPKLPALILASYMLPIFGAAVHADSTVLKSLIEAGADVNQPSQDCWQPKDYALRIACEKGLVDNVRLLLEAGADLNATNSKGARAVDAAAGSGHDDLLMMLLDSE
jgi:ankyrin repeat protein